MQALDKAKQLRQKSTLAEKIIWHQLRNRKLDSHKFRRQFPIEHYIVDFICLSEKLIIELDGKYHEGPDQIGYDQVRSIFLEAGGYKILRFTNQQVTDELSDVLLTIKLTLSKK